MELHASSHFDTKATFTRDAYVLDVFITGERPRITTTGTENGENAFILVKEFESLTFAVMIKKMMNIIIIVGNIQTFMIIQIMHILH